MAVAWHWQYSIVTFDEKNEQSRVEFPWYTHLRFIFIVKVLINAVVPNEFIW